MNRLIGVELDRYFSRRLIRLGLAAMLVLSGLLVLAAWNDAKPPSAADVAQAQHFYQQDLKSWTKDGPQQVKDCRAQEKQDKADTLAAGGDPGTVQYGCDDLAPTLQSYLGSPPSFVEQAPSILETSSYLVVLVAAVLGVSFVAAEFATGAIGNWLTFEPRRLRVYLSKICAAFVATVPPVVVGLGIVLGGTCLVYAHYDELGHAQPGQWAGVWWEAARILLLAAVAAVVGAALAVLLRHTAAVLGLVVGWAVLVEAVLTGLVPGLHPWTAATNVTGWVRGGTDWFTERCVVTADGQDCGSFAHHLTQAHAGTFLGVGALVVVLLASAVFRRRDVG